MAYARIPLISCIVLCLMMAVPAACGGAQPLRYEDIAYLTAQGSYGDAEKICRERLSMNSGDPAALTQLGEVYWETGKRRAAIRLFRKAMKAAPGYPVSYFFLGKAYAFERKPEKAIAQFKIYKKKMGRITEFDEYSSDFYVYSLGYISYLYTTMKRYADAAEGYKEIIRLAPDNQSAEYNLAVSYYTHEHNVSKTYAQLNKVIEIDPSTHLADKAKFFIDYLRRNPDARYISDFTFIEEK